MINKNNIVLNSLENNNKKAILILEKDNQDINGMLRLYNFNKQPNGILTLGIYSNNKVVKAGLTYKGNSLYRFLLSNELDINNFSCALVNFEGGEAKPILFGNTIGCFSKDELYEEILEKLNGSSNMKDVENVLDESGLLYDEDYQKEIDNCIDENLNKCESNCVKDCKDCKYKEFYLQSLRDNDICNALEVEETDEPEVDNSFYNDLKDDIQILFKDNPSEIYLEKLIPNSKWVKVKVEENEYYVLGLIYEDDIIKYICYGIPGIYQQNPPRQLSGQPVWFPLTNQDNKGFGYWISYQDADSGESVKAVIV